MAVYPFFGTVATVVGRLLRLQGTAGASQVQRRIRELHPAYSKPLRLRACFVGDREAERFAHRRFANLHVKNELFTQHPLIDAYFANCRVQMRERIKTLHVCGPACAQTIKRLDLRMLSAWLAR